MELHEALRTIEATTCMFSSIVTLIKDTKGKMLYTPVENRTDNVWDLEKCNADLVNTKYFTFMDGDKPFVYTMVNIYPVCKYVVNEWPSPNAEKIRDRLKSALQECVSISDCVLREYIDGALSEEYLYRRRYIRSSDDVLTIKIAMLDILNEMYITIKQTNLRKEDENDMNTQALNTEHLLEKIKTLQSEVDKLTKENESLKQKIEEKESEIAFNGTGKECFTKAKMWLLIHTIASITDGPIPIKARFPQIISAIGGWEETSVNAETKKAGFNKSDIEAVAKVFEKSMPNFAAEIRKQSPRPKKTKK